MQGTMNLQEREAALVRREAFLAAQKQLRERQQALARAEGPGPRQQLLVVELLLQELEKYREDWPPAEAAGQP